jgi:signal transduction histidine kinase
MRVVALTPSPHFAAMLKAYCDPCGIVVTAQSELAAVANQARVTDAIVIHRQHVDGAAIALLERAALLGFREVFLISTDAMRPEWEERAYLAGATVVAQEPVRAALLVAQLKRAAARSAPATTFDRIDRGPPPAAESASAAIELTTTRTMVRLLSQAHSADAFTDAFLQHLCDQIAVSRLALYLTTLDPFARDLTCIFATGVDAETFKHIALSLDRGIGGFLRQHGIVLTLNGQVEIDAQAAYEMNALGAHVAVPVSDRSSLTGVLLLGRHITGEPLRREEIEVVFHLMSDMGLVLRNARLNQNLSEERAFFAAVLEQIGVGSMVVDEQLRVLHSSRCLAAAIEHTDAAPIRFEHLPQPLATAVYEIASGSAPEARTLMHRTSRAETFRISIEPFRVASAPKTAVLVLSQNYTEVENGRRLAVRTERDELLNRMAAQFAHVIRNSLTQVSTFAQLLPTKHRDPEFISDLTARLPVELDRLLRTADQLEWLKREPGQPTAVDLTERINAAWAKLNRSREPKRTRTLQSTVPPMFVLAEADAVDEIVAEVLANATEAAGPKGAVEISADEPVDGVVTIHFHDDGPGFSEEALAHATVPFFTTKNSGVGLGLTVVQRLVGHHGGVLTLGRSQRRSGADVAISFPFQSP